MKNQIKLVLLIVTASFVSPAFAWCHGEYECRSEAATQQMIDQMHQNEQAMYDREHQALAETMGATFVPTHGGYGPGEFWINGGEIVCGYNYFGIGCVDRNGNPAPQYAPSKAQIKAAFARADGTPLPPVKHRRHRRR